MKFLIYYCKKGNYSTKGFEAKVDKRVLHTPNGKKVEVDCYFEPQIIGLSDGKFNVMFNDTDESVGEYERKYFTNATWVERFKLRKQFGKLWLQKEPLAVIAIIVAVLVPLAVEILKTLLSAK